MRAVEDGRALWGTSATDLFAVGAQGTILHYDGSSATDVFTVGPSIYHFNGTSWSSMVAPSNQLGYRKVWGASANDVFVIGGYGTIYHYGPKSV
jgi:hypothetical protein